MTVTEIHLGVPCTYEAQQEMLDKGYTLQPHAHGVHRQRYVMALRSPRLPFKPNFVVLAARVFDISPDDILRYCRVQRPVRARQAGMWAARQYGLSYPVIGRMFSRHHTTIMNAVARARERRWADDAFKAKTVQVMSMVRSA